MLVAAIKPNRGNLSLRQLHYFDAIARLGSLKRAAEELHITQPALTYSLHRLEQRLGCQLFDRQTGGSFPTPEGQIFRLRVERSLRFLRSAFDPIQAKDADVHRAPILRSATGPQLAALVAIDAQQSFRHAAEQLNISLSALNKHARDLELVVGQPLFMAMPSGRTTNRRGKQMAGRIRLALREVDAGREEVANFNATAASSIVIGMLPISAARLVSLAIEGMAQRFPSAWIKVLEGPFESLEHWLRSGQIDIIVTTLRNDRDLRDLHQHGLFNVPYSLVARRGHPLAGQPEIAALDICDYEWILPRQGTPRRAAAEELFARLGSRPHVQVETSSLTLTQRLLVAGDRITIFSREQSLHGDEAGALTTLRYRVPDSDRMLGTITRIDWLPTAPQQYLLEMLRARRYEDL
ncbi:LysR family transcriptional regulator [Mangrovibrevibacter kandeliae]|uniref:LysR family transcriptional regulator n=1 Tax=Mangrovibrevibacter kandeliae TaxID=2968473 RepID=UPI002118F509|nr:MULTISPECIES: LysR family transcriptional regulator [unclassified Aurantimonas]MCQ8781564.1 LysR family transcriptional regulator [Aurantimonas sp. CSK15Z-1]MCW4114338.1 LysR family transcriptional regulator [Aurantimonas sp. MSK8Z-1]